MKKQSILPIIFAAIALLLLTACVFLTASYTAYRIKTRNADAPPGELPPVSDQELSKTPNKDSGGQNDQTPSGPDDPSPSENSEDSPAQPAALLKKTADGGQTYIDSLVFLGDSTTYGMLKAKALKDGENSTQVWRGPNGTLSLLAATAHYINDGSYQNSTGGKKLGEIAKDKQPKILVITLGVGVSFSAEEATFKKAYGAVIDTVLASSPDTKIICNSIYPVCEQKWDEFKNINNPDIVKCNNWILEKAEEYHSAGKAVYYLDSYGVLVGSDGFLPAFYSNGDGLHLSATAFSAVLENLRTHVIPE